MVCNNGRKAALREMQILLEFIEAENCELVVEKNILTAEFRSIPPDERAIAKNISNIQSEFKGNLNSTKACAEFLDEYHRKKIHYGPNHILQEIQSKKLDLIARQEKILRLLSEQRWLEAENKKILEAIVEKESQIQSWQKILEKYKVLDSHKEFISQSDMLEEKCEELSELIRLFDSYELVVSGVISFETIKAENELKKVYIHNKTLMSEISNANQKNMNLKKEVDSKNKQLSNLWVHYFELEMQLKSLNSANKKTQVYSKIEMNSRENTYNL